MEAQPGMVLSIYLDRSRDVSLAYGDPAPLHRDLDLHLLANGIAYDDFTRNGVRDGLSALALIIVSRPRFATFGWTLSLQAPARNFFWTGSASEGTVVGRAFLENVQESPRNLFFVQTSRTFGDLQTSSVEVEGTGVFSIVEQFCERSDQQPARFFNRGDRVALLTVFPDGDREWVRAAGAPEIFEREGTEDLKLIGEKEIVFRCGCDRDRIASILATLYRDAEEDLFQGDGEVEAECPRCGAKHVISRELFREAGQRGARPD
jgi:molecular chaperone Hsp33